MNNTSAPPTGIDCFPSQLINGQDIMAFRQIMDYTLFPMAICASCLQVIVITIATSCYMRKSNTMHIFAISMTAADFLLTAIGYPLEFGQRLGLIKAFKPVNAIVNMLWWLGALVSGFSLILLNIDKLVFVNWPFRYNTIITKRKAFILTALCWLFSAGFLAAMWLTGSVSCFDDDCTHMPLFADNIYANVLFMAIIFGVIPTLSSLVISLYLLRVVLKMRRKFPYQACSASASDQQMPRHRLKSLTFIFATTIWTAISLLPFPIVNIFYVFLYYDAVKNCPATLIWWILMYLLHFNPIINPIITVTVLPFYRIRLIKFCTNDSGRKKKKSIESRQHDLNSDNQIVAKRNHENMTEL